jgi:hypothetical protein
MLDVNDVLRQAPTNFDACPMRPLSEAERNQLVEQLRCLDATGNMLNCAEYAALKHNFTTTLLERVTPATGAAPEGAAPEAVEEETEEETEEEMEEEETDKNSRCAAFYESWKPSMVHLTLWINPEDKPL